MELLADWCRRTGLSIIQLLPMNDVGFNFRPYDSESSIALEPMHLCLEKVRGVSVSPFMDEIRALRKKFPLDSCWFDTAVKKEKLKVLKKMFLRRKPQEDIDFTRYRSEQRFWLESYALFKCIKAKMGQTAWEAWPGPLRDREDTAIRKVKDEQKDELEFQEWLQWQLYSQFCDAAASIRKKGVYLMGDLPFLAARDSADVWSQPRYFKLHLSAGAPPDLYFAGGQEWGMPPYDWAALESGGYDYLVEKLKYAENFYDLFRIDHFVGLFRVWTLASRGSEAERKKSGAFDPAEESLWEAQGERILSVILSNSRMLPCAEDLGTVPECSFRVLEKYALPGMEIQRWMRDWGRTFGFKSGDEYRLNSIVTLSTHDMTPFAVWWDQEAGTVKRRIFESKCREYGVPFETLARRLFDKKQSDAEHLRWKKDVVVTQELDILRELHSATFDEKEKFWKAVGLGGAPESRCSEKLVLAALEAAGQARSVFSIQLLQDWLALSDKVRDACSDARINEPGLVHEKNWRFRVPIYLEDMNKMGLNRTLRTLNQKTKRA